MRLFPFILFYLAAFSVVAQTKQTVFHYRTGEIMEKGKLKKGLRQGTWTEYYKSGSVKSTSFYQKGLTGGPAYTYSGKEYHYHQNGTIKEEYIFHKGQLHGVQKYFYANGQLKKELTCVNGLYYTTIKEYYPDSAHTLKSAFTYEWNLDSLNAKKFKKSVAESALKADSILKRHSYLKSSSWQYYYSSGILKTEGTFVKGTNTNGKKDKWQELQYENLKVKTPCYEGSVAYEEDTSKFRFTGKEYLYYEAHTVREVRNWVNGKMEGMQKQYYPDGALKKEIPCVNGLFHGTLKEYYTSGTVYSEINYANGKAISAKKTYYPNGILRSEGPMKDGCIHLYDTLGVRIKPKWNNYWGGMDDKPVIYLYPEKETDVTVTLQYSGNFTYTYPEYKNGWSVKAFPDGKIINHEDHQEYSYLFWEGENRNDYMDSIELFSGALVSGKETQEYLRKTLAGMGLIPKEYNEFIVYWLPKMIHNKYNYIHFITGKEYDKIAGISILPKPDALLRIFMIFQSLENPIETIHQTITPFTREGFTVVEWGGTQTKSLIQF